MLPSFVLVDGMDTSSFSSRHDQSSDYIFTRERAEGNGQLSIRLPPRAELPIFMNASALLNNQTDGMYTDATLGMERPIPVFEKQNDNAEQNLIEHCKRGDAFALRTLYEAHRNDVYRITARMLDNEADRDEVVQDIFLQIFKSIGKFKGHSKLSTWVHKVAFNVILQHIRKKKHRIRLQLTDTPADEKMAPESRQLTPEEEAVSLEKRVAVQRALGTLSPKKRAVLILHDFEGIQAKEIAKIVGASVMTVRTRLFYAREGFYQLLAKEPAFSDIVEQGGIL